MPQVAQDKRCFPLNKETVKNTFVSEQVCVSAFPCLWALAHACVPVCDSARRWKLTHKLCY